MRVAVVDGQGGGIGRAIVEKVKKAFPELEVVALGTNSVATGQMLKAGADDGATGENAIIHNMQHVDIVMGDRHNKCQCDDGGDVSGDGVGDRRKPDVQDTASDKPLPHTYRQRRRAVCQRSCRQCRESARPFPENKVVLGFKDM